MSAEDLELHQPGVAPVKSQYLTLKGSLGDGVDGLLQKGKRLLQSRSLPSLVDIPSCPNEEEEEEDVDEEDVSTTEHKEQARAMIKVVVEHAE